MQIAFHPQPGDVERKLAEIYPDPDQRRAVDVLLADLTDRVTLAVLRLAGANMRSVETYAELARVDYRDVLAPAESPHYLALGLHPDLESAECLAAIAADIEQYREWVYGS
jgi:hypothetical protein